MKVVTNGYKNNIKLLGKELDSKITYTINGVETELGSEELNSVTPHYQADIMKSVMKQLDIESNVEIPIGTELNYQFGLKVGNAYEYINYGNYIVYSVEKQEDTDSYKIICYDKMLYAMVDYETPKISGTAITYPITVRDYISAICSHLGLTFKNAGDTFANYNRQIQSELYLDNGGNSLNYTFRDVLDELAEVTASVICINENDDELEIRYPNTTNQAIDEEWLKDVNVAFGEKYGPINSVVLSRSAESDNVYLKDDTSIANNGLCEIKITDNQIMNWNDRSDYLPDIFSKLGNMEYYINDYSSPGITFLELYDKYNVSVGENTYNCIMLNDELNITQGMEENVNTPIPKTSETDYKKADKTDRKINQTYLIVDKQNNSIEAMSSQITDQNEEIASIRLQYNELLSRISDIADITTSGESSYASVNLVEVNTSQPIDIKIHPISENISYLYPYNGLYPSDTLYPKARTLRFTNTSTNEVFDWELPTNLWYYDNTTYDELELSYGDGANSTVTVTRKCAIDSNATISALATPTSETYSYPTSLVLTDGDYTVSLLGYNTGYLYVQLMAKNIYTTQFYTKAETNSLISQTASSITLGVNQTLSNYSTTNEMNSAITLKANEITSSVSETYATKSTTNQLSSRISQTAKSIALSVNNGSASSGITITTTKEDGTTDTATGTIQMNGLVKFTDLSTSGSTTINGSNITTGSINANLITSGSLSANRISGGTINGNNVSVTNLNASNITTGTLNGRAITNGSITNATYKYGGSYSTITINDADDGSIYGYYTRNTSSLTTANMRFALNAFTAGGKLTCWGSSGTSGSYAWFNNTGAHTSSDIRYKKHIENIEQEKSVNIITNLTPITYDYDDNSYHRGLSAQEVERILNDNGIENQIYEIDKNGRYSLNYVELIPDLINCIKYLNNKIEKLERESDK